MAAVGASAITAATTDSGLTNVISSVQIASASFTDTVSIVWRLKFLMMQQQHQI